MIDLDERLRDFDDTAAVVKQMDLVISCDTALAHLAGALQVPVWLAIRYAPDWRWLLDRSDTPWYPTMRIYRQPQPGDWQGLFEQMQQPLQSLVEQRLCAVR